MAPRYAKKRDDNHAEVKAMFEALGCTVIDLASTGNGVPDLLVGTLGVWRLVEIKDGSKPPSAQTLTAAEQRLKDRCEAGRLPWCVCKSTAGAEMLVAQWRG